MPDISDTLAPNSNQLDNIDLRGGPPRIFTVTKVDVRKGDDQPVSVHLAEFPRPWKPGKNMRRVLAHCWGARLRRLDRQARRVVRRREGEVRQRDAGGHAHLAALRHRRPEVRTHPHQPGQGGHVQGRPSPRAHPRRPPARRVAHRQRGTPRADQGRRSVSGRSVRRWAQLLRAVSRIARSCERRGMTTYTLVGRTDPGPDQRLHIRAVYGDP